MWKKYDVTNYRSVWVSQELYDYIKKFSNEKKNTVIFMFNTAIRELRVIWKECIAKDDDIEKSYFEAEKKLRQIFTDHPMPGYKKRRQKTIHLKITSEQAVEWIRELEAEFQLFDGMEEFVRRLFTWYLTKEGYITNGQNQKSKIVPDFVSPTPS